MTKNPFFILHSPALTQTLILFSSLAHSRNPSCIDASKVIGFILNVPNDYKFGFVVFPFKRRHWIAVREINNEYWNLDSKLNSPEKIGNEHDLQSYLSNQLKSNDKELFVVVDSEIEKSKNWLREQ